jgi:rubrerythrin
MPGHILQCQSCGATVRVGYSALAVSFAAQKRGVDEAEIIEDYYEFNHSLREDPAACPKCKAPKTSFKEIEKLA